MKTVIAILMGAVSGFLIYVMITLLIIGPNTDPTTAAIVVPLAFIGGWILSTWLLLRGASGASSVLRRGFLLGAGEWLAMAAVGVIFSGKAVAATNSGGDAASSAGAAVGGGIVAMLAGGVSVFMAVVCLIGFAIAYFTGREMQDTTSTPTKKCPECAEMVQAEARKCKHCGAALVAPPIEPAAPTA